MIGQTIIHYRIQEKFGVGGTRELEPFCGREPAGEILSELSEGSAC